MTISIDKLTLANDDAAIDRAIAGIHKKSATLQLDIHKVLVAIAKRWESTGDVRPAVKHVNTLLAKGQLGGMRTNAIKAWVQEFFGFIVVEEGEAKGSFVFGKLKAGALDLVAIVENKWWEFKPEAEYKPMDFDKMLMALLSKAEKRTETATEQDKVDPALIAAVKLARANYIASAH